MFLTSTKTCLTERGAAQSRVLEAGTLILTNSGATLGVPKITSIRAAANDGIAALINLQGVEPKYLYYCLQSSTQHLREVVAPGNGQPNLNTELIGEITVLLPPLLEQQQIAAMLEDWDTAITTTEKLLANSRRQKQALSQALLSGRRRLDTSTKWHRKKIAELISESRIPGSTGDVARKLTVKLYGKGVVAKEERRQGSESTIYYQRRAGQFIYSKLDFLNGAFGLIPTHLDGYESTLDLPAFDFLDGVDPRWFLYYVSREEFYQGHLGLANGGRKARRVNPVDLLRVCIDCPSQVEQRAIADAIDTACADERKWEAMSSLLKAEKRALMADLLTGKRRVRLSESATEERVAA